VHGDGRDIVLMGRTNDAAILPTYLRKLGLEERFKGRRFAQFDVNEVAQEGAGGGVVQFTMRSVVANETRSDRPAAFSTQDALRAVERVKEDGVKK